MAKFKYRIEGGRYGGELAVGEVSEDFAQYWAPIIEEEGTYETFIPHVLALSEWDDEEDINRDAPAIFEDLNEIEGWYAVDDIEHINGAYADGGFFVSNITDEEDEWAYDENEMEVEGYCLKGREGAYISTNTEPTSEACQVEVNGQIAELRDLLGKLHNQKIWYRPKSKFAYIGG